MNNTCNTNLLDLTRSILQSTPGDRLAKMKAALAARGLSMADLARKWGVSHNHVREVILGTRAGACHYKLIEFLGLPASEIWPEGESGQAEAA